MVQTSGRKRPVASAKPATVPVGSAVGSSRDREGGAAGPEAQGEVARAEAEAEGGRHVVARARERPVIPAPAPLAGDGVRSEDLGECGVPVDVAR